MNLKLTVLQWVGLLVAFALIGSSLERELNVRLGAQSTPEATRLKAEDGEATAQRDLGFMYAAGRGVEQDDKEAARWLLLAAEQGEPSAQASLGFAYALGKGVSLDYVEAYKWLELAVSRASVESRRVFERNREVVALEMTATELQVARCRVREWSDRQEGGSQDVARD